MTSPSLHPTILGLDPGTHEMGAAVLSGRKLLAFGVHTLRNKDHPRDIIDQARRIVLSYISEFGPATVAIEKPLLVPTKRAALVSVIADELRARARELGLQVREISAPEARKLVAGNPGARKLETAQAIVAMGFESLKPKLPDPPHPVLGFRARDKYWLHAFDALAVALAAQKPLIPTPR
jgi:Holliday junction resolvasome RuvABC endonuclease subunit